MTMEAAFSLAGKQIGLNEREQAAALTDYLKNGGQNLNPQELAWCAAFVNASLEQSGIKGTGSNMARSFLDWGQEVDTPQRGDLAVFSRGDPNGPYGHVGFFDGYNPDGTIRVLGGNQQDAVNVLSYSADNLLGFRRAGDGAPTNALQAMPQEAPQQNRLAQGQPGFRRPEVDAIQQDVTPFLRPVQRNALSRFT